MSILLLGGSPSASSSSRHLLAHIGEQITGRGHLVHHLDVRDLPADGLLGGERKHCSILRAISQVADARAIVIASPVYKAAYSGLLKAFLDLLPQDAFQGKPILPVATSGSPAHMLAIEYSLRPVLSALGATNILAGVYAHAEQIRFDPELGLQLESSLAERCDRATLALTQELTGFSPVARAA